MSRSFKKMLPLLLAVFLFSCNGNKPKPVSDAIAKTTITVNGKKDSVINNPQKNYGNATIGDPCVRCLLQVIQADSGYKKSAGKSGHIKYVINYVKTTQPQDTVSDVKATNALRIDVIDSQQGSKKLLSYVYDNSLGKIYSVQQTIKTELITDSNALLRIRNGCYWGVASTK